MLECLRVSTSSPGSSGTKGHNAMEIEAAHEIAEQMIQSEARVPHFAFQMPEDGKILEPGAYFAQWATPPDKTLPVEMLAETLQGIRCTCASCKGGGCDECERDGSRHAFKPCKIESVTRHEAQGVLQVTTPLRIRTSPSIVWSTMTRLPIDPFMSLNNTYIPFALEPGKTYATRVILREKSNPDRADVLHALDKMGFFVRALVFQMKDMRLPGRPGAAVSQWFAIATWRQPKSYTTDRDPLFFEDLAEIS